MGRGLFFSFDGIDGTGKSTQIDLFSRWLVDSGCDVVKCRDPGTTPLGETLRDIVLRSEQPIGARSETMIYMAARAQLVEEIIEPALAAEQTVVSDRYLLANVVYQAYGLDLAPEDVWRLGEFATRGRYPDATFVLDLDVATASQRVGKDVDRMEQRDTEYHRRVRNGFIKEAEQDSSVHLIDASLSIDQVHDQVRALAGPLLGLESVRRGASHD